MALGHQSFAQSASHEIFSSGTGYSATRGLPIGVRNARNSGWFSSVLQLLFHLPEVRRIVLESSPSREGRDEKDVALLKAMRIEFASMQDRRVSAADPSACLRALDSMFPNEEILFGREDAAEILDRIVQCLQRVTVSDDGSSLLSPFFRGMIQQCGVESGYRDWREASSEAFSFVLDTSSRDLDVALENYFVASDREKWIVSPSPVSTFLLNRSHSPASSFKHNNYFRIPETIFIDRYRRKNYEEVRTAKEQKILLHREKRRLRKEIDSTRNQELRRQYDEYRLLPDAFDDAKYRQTSYELHAILMHSGSSLMAGHYFLYVKHHQSGWLECNDSTVSQVSWERVKERAFGGNEATTSAIAVVYFLSRSKDDLLDYDYRLLSDVDGYKLDPVESLPSDIREMMKRERGECRAGDSRPRRLSIALLVLDSFAEVSLIIESCLDERSKYTIACVASTFTSSAAIANAELGGVRAAVRRTEEELTEELSSLGIDAVFVIGKMPLNSFIKRWKRRIFFFEHNYLPHEMDRIPLQRGHLRPQQSCLRHGLLQAQQLLQDTRDY